MRLHLPSHHAGFAGAFIIALLLVLGGAFTLWFASQGADALRAKHQRETHDALLRARDALRVFAASNPDRGYLPCPAQPPPAQPGIAATSCTALGLRVGRLPWRTLQLPDLRDGNGDSLWYAVSGTLVNDNAKINSTISAGAISIDGVSGTAAIVFSPGEPLAGQNRAPTPAVCSTIGSTIRADYCAANYLDLDTTNGIANGDANSSFTRGATPPFNDQLVGIAAAELFPGIEERVLSEVKSCLLAYSNHASNTFNSFPWAHPVNVGDPFDSTATYDEVANTEIGRIPDALLAGANYWAAMPHCPLPRCTLAGACSATRNWLTDWRELIFYVVSPDAGQTAGVTVNTPAAVAAKAVVLLAGSPLGTQTRAAVPDGQLPDNYLEGLDLSTFVTGPRIWELKSPTSTFNDKVRIVAP